tara:strand:- start:283 stop:504 length:222 start_codon:yes stop_codon:yes gene_type:complete
VGDNTDTLFWDIVNQEDWPEDFIDNTLPFLAEGVTNQLPITNVLFPTPVPGVFISYSVSYEVIQPDEGEEYHG